MTKNVKFKSQTEAMEYFIASVYPNLKRNSSTLSSQIARFKKGNLSIEKINQILKEHLNLEFNCYYTEIVEE